MAGLPAKTVRDMLRRLNIYSLMDALFVAARCEVSPRKAKEAVGSGNSGTSIPEILARSGPAGKTSGRLR